MKRKATWLLVGPLSVAAVTAGSWWLISQRPAERSGRGPGDDGPVPVELAPVEHGPIERRRTLSGELQAAAEFVVAPKIGGRLQRMTVDLADAVRRGQLVAELDDQELRQAAAEARAQLTVARAKHKAANNRLEIAERALERVKTLHQRGIASEQELDGARADYLQADGEAEVAASEVQRARAAYRAAEVRASYAKVTADWPGEDEERVVAARYADEGETVQPNTALLSIVDLDPVKVAVHVTDRDYAELQPGQRVSVTTDAYPSETFEGEVSRVAPVFQSDSRQARVELIVRNPDHRLKPGMFVRAVTVLDRIEDATIVPEDALVTRDGQQCVFVVPDDGHSVTLRAVQTGLRDRGRVQVHGEGIEGRVVTLGQQRLEDGAAITVPSGPGSEESTRDETAAGVEDTKDGA